MAEKENFGSMIRLGLILAAYAVISCAILALVNTVIQLVNSL